LWITLLLRVAVAVVPLPVAVVALVAFCLEVVLVCWLEPPIPLPWAVVEMAAVITTTYPEQVAPTPLFLALA
jgi:hypothetical protein